MTNFGDADLIENIEDTFQVSLSEEEASKTRTLDELTAVVLSKVETCPSADCETQRVFYQLRNLIMARGFRREEIRPNTDLSSLFPRSGRRSTWKKVGIKYGPGWPDLRFPRGVVGPVGIVSLVAVGIPAIVYISPLILDVGTGFLAASTILGLWICIFAGILEALEPMRTVLPDKTVGDFVRSLTAHSPLRNGWTKERVRLTLQQMSIEDDAPEK